MNRRKILTILGVLLLEVILWFFPYAMNWSENKWRWVNDEGPSFLVYLVLGWGSRVLFFIILIVLAIMLIIRAWKKPVSP